MLLDSNILLYLLGGDQTLIPLLEGKQLYVSFITQLELLGFKNLNVKELQQVAQLLSNAL